MWIVRDHQELGQHFCREKVNASLRSKSPAISAMVVASTHTTWSREFACLVSGRPEKPCVDATRTSTSAFAPLVG